MTLTSGQYSLRKLALILTCAAIVFGFAATTPGYALWSTFVVGPILGIAIGYCWFGKCKTCAVLGGLMGGVLLPGVVGFIIGSVDHADAHRVPKWGGGVETGVLTGILLAGVGAACGLIIGTAVAMFGNHKHPR